MIKSSVFKDIGRFSEDYFMYAEDVDLCMKVQKAGFKNVYVPSAEIIHFKGGATKENLPGKFSTVLMCESNYLLLKKFNGVLYATAFRSGLFIISFVRMGLIAFSGGIFSLLKIRKNWKSSLIRWKYIFSWSRGKEHWCVNYDGSN